MFYNIAGKGLETGALFNIVDNCRAERDAAVKASATKEATKLVKHTEKAYKVISKGSNIMGMMQINLKTLLAFFMNGTGHTTVYRCSMCHSS